MATRRKSPRGGRDEVGFQALVEAWKEWHYGVLRRCPRDTPSRQVTEVLQALIACAADPEAPDLRKALSKLAKHSRPIGMSAGASSPAIIESIDKLVRKPAAKRWSLAAESVLGQLWVSGLFGEPAGGHDAALDRIKSALSKHSVPLLPNGSPVHPVDVDEAIVAVLVAFGVERAKARNALKYRRMRETRV